MFNIGSWNTWGLNSLQKQKTVHHWTQKNNLDIFGLLETKLEVSNLAAAEANLAPSCWHYISNIHHTSHCRILVGWNSHKLNLIYEDSSPQWLSCIATTLSSTHPLKITFIYSHNTPSERMLLWNHICQESTRNIGIPWIVLGDFNAILTADDRVGGDMNWYRHQDDFHNCIRQSELLQIPYTGIRFTWHNGQHGDHIIQKKLDWIFGNQCLFSTWPAAHSVFQPRHISDHSAMILHLQTDSYKRQVPFKFLNLWADRDDFLGTVSSSWQATINGNPMYQLTTKLRLLKHELKKLHQQHTSHITSRVSQAKDAWYAAQTVLDANPTSHEARTNERCCAHQYMQLCKDEESFYQQRSRVQWLQLGDRNTKFFHKSLLHRQVRNRIHHLMDDEGNIIHDQQKMSHMAVSFFEQLLSTPQPPLTADIAPIYPNTISAASTTAMLLPLTNDEIKAALFSIPDNKAPGPDGYNAFFFKKCWSIIGADFIAATRYFFTNNTLPRCVNATRVALVPKVENPSCMNDFRPISCCNVLYKCISKIIVSRLKTALDEVIGPSQSAFLPGRNISDAILLTQELMHNSHLSNGPANCALKIDLRKAFDTVSWEFILAGLEAIAIPQCMITWIKICISTAHYTINMNGELHGFFKSTRGLRQGDPLSPYLFVLAMEGLGGILRNATQDTSFRYHWHCKPNSITHLCFADDLMLFCNADTNSVGILKSCLDRFSQLSGLTINRAKSFLYLSGINRELQHEIQQQLGFQQGILPVKYLGVPLISTRLTHADCLPLVERIISRIKLWTSASLTYAGRLQLIQAVLFSIQVYWSSMFILPCATIRKIESILASFLWKGASLSSNGSKVSWSSICYPLQEGGLGIKSLKTWNKAATMKHIWRLFEEKQSIWATWIHTIHIRNRSFWHIKLPSSPSWSWRKILQSREWCKGWFIPCIGDGRSTSLWFDYWLPGGTRLIDTFSLRTLTSTGLPWTAKVSDIINGEHWQFPCTVQDLQPAWNSINFYPNSNRKDHYIWVGHPSGKFTVASAWELLRDKKTANTMHKLLWYKGYIPRQSFILWLASQGRLSTMDRLHMTGIISSATCMLCDHHIETHDHLFFQCSYSTFVWKTVSNKALVHWPSTTWDHLLQWSSNIYTKNNDITHLIARLLLSTTVYFIWHERNNRVFHNNFQPPSATVDAILQRIRIHIRNINYAGNCPSLIQDIWGLCLAT